jgi:hypothetical protein
MYLDEEIFNSEFNERLAKERAQNYMRLKDGYKDPKDKHVQSVINKFAERSEIGLIKYGTTLERNDLNLIDWLTHLQEELMDATLYCEKLKELSIRKDRNDFAFGFADWIRVCKLKGRPYDFENTKELLEIYKNEKGL